MTWSIACWSSRRRRRRGVKPDAEKVKQRLARYEARSKHAPNWDKERARLLESMTVQLENQSRYEQFEAQARKVPEPTEAQARAYYEAHKELFRRAGKAAAVGDPAEGRSRRGEGRVGQGA